LADSRANPEAGVRKDHAGFTPLSDIEASYLFRETAPGTWITGALLLFEPDPGAPQLELDQLRATAKQRIGLVPKLRRRVVHMPLDLAAPVLEDDPDFDIERHLVAVRADGPVDRSAIVAAASRLMSTPIDLEHPPWQIALVAGTDREPAALVTRVHHVYGGALDQIPMMMALLIDGLDSPDTADHPRVPARPMTFGDRARHTVGELGRDVREFVSEMRKDVKEGSLRDFAELESQVADAIKAKARSGLFLGEPSGERTVALADVPMDTVTACRHGFGFRATFNDIALDGLAGGIRRYLEGRSETLDNPIVHIPAVPHTMPGEEADDEVAQVTGAGYAMLLELPVDVADPVVRLQRIAEAMSEKKAAAATDEIRRVDALFNFAFPRVQAAETNLLHGAKARNFGFTNAPGPTKPLFVHGRRTAGGYMFKHLKADQGFGAGVISLAGKLHFGFCADPVIVPDVGYIADGVAEELDALGRLAADGGSAKA
jgi:diacylglycerol O-acyltransferase / wax synthase